MQANWLRQLFIGILTIVIAASVIGSFTAYTEAVQTKTKVELMYDTIKEIKKDINYIKDCLIKEHKNDNTSNR